MTDYTLPNVIHHVNETLAQEGSSFRVAESTLRTWIADYLNDSGCVYKVGYQSRMTKQGIQMVLVIATLRAQGIRSREETIAALDATATPIPTDEVASPEPLSALTDPETCHDDALFYRVACWILCGFCASAGFVLVAMAVGIMI